ncbi:MAG: alpha-mannosidase [Clostridiales bacterium]|nr:alpha-mannosidase [Clostridiales bacterium]
MRLDILRLKRLLEDLQKMIYRFELPIGNFKILDDKRQDGYELDTSSWHDFTVGENWKAEDAYRWFKTTIVLPEEYTDETVVFRITTGREGQWDACNPQFLFYVNERLVQGCDVNHREVILTDSAKRNESFDIAFLAYGGTEGKDLLIQCHLMVLDSETEALYYDLKMPIETAELIYEKDAYNRIKLINGLNPVADRLDLRRTYTLDYYDMIADCRNMLKKTFYSDISDQPVVYAIGNTHIDIAWLWTVEQTREKVLRSYATVIELMDRYPDYKFIGSQAILYQFVKEQKPDLYERVKEKVRSGQWEVDGGMWLEADCNIPSGESLVRQLLKGERFFEEEFGVRSKTLWLPDVFGYSAALPQILKQFDIPYFVTTKLAWNQYNQLPNDVFKWRGLDGSEVFTFMPTTTDYNKNLGKNISFTDTRNTTTYTGILGPNMTLGTYQRFQNKDIIEDTLMLYGFGDGGGGPTREMLENEKRLKYGLPGIPRIETSFNSTYLDMAYNKLKDGPSTPTWDGELYFEYHRGTLTSNGSVKRWNRKLEIMVRKLEILTVIDYIEKGIQVPKEALEQIWDIILLNQFHDIIPGTSIAEVYETTEKEYQLAYDIGQSLLNTEHEKSSVTVFNDLSFNSTDVVKMIVKTDDIVALDSNQPVQYIAEDEVVFIADDVPAFGFKSFEFIKGEKKLNSKELITHFDFENEYYSVCFNSKGEVTSLTEKLTDYEYINGVGNQIIAFEDRPANWDNWDLDVFYQRKPYMFETSEMYLTESGPVRWTIETIHTMGNSVIKQKIHLYKALPRIEFVHDVEWQENNLLLRTQFPTTIYQNKATYDIQFGSVERETTNNNSWDLAKFETCGHKWMDLGNNGVGLSLMSESKYGYSAKQSVMGLSLIKSGTYPNKTADIGKHHYSYAIYPHIKRWSEAQTIEQAERFNSELTVINSPNESAEPLINIVEGDVFVDVIKLSEDGNRVIVRLHEHKNAYTHIQLKVSSKLKASKIVNLREEIQESIEMNNQLLKLTFGPFEIKTLSFDI